MNTSSAIHSHTVATHVSDMVDSITQRASAAIARFDPNAARTDANDPTTETTFPEPFWMQSPQTRTDSTSRARQYVLFAAIAVAHVFAAAALAYVKMPVRDAAHEPIQVLALSEPANEVSAPPPSVPAPKLTTYEIPVEPVTIEIAVAPTNAITVAAAPAQPHSAPASMGAPKLVSSVEYIREPEVRYPPAARALKQHGVVTIRALIDAEGHAREVNVHRTSGYKLLDDAARKAVFDALFKPYAENGRPQPVYVLIPIEFGAV